ncbi:lytic transglycosylase domain-containing protein [Thiohalocapsa marina]|uniref:lytic transglycosylase domain-containing protein n=1 Tax=Thiohalocapsa marina TaxID=424902 RepID=UPI0014785F3B|nr:lytic transglycosylase domain-containing protein [Thiohalocapsa marina]
MNVSSRECPAAVAPLAAGPFSVLLPVLLLLGMVCGAGSTQAMETGSVERSRTQALPQPPDRPRPTRARIDELIARYAKQHRLERGLVHAVVRAESNYDAHAVSPAGAVGLMQIMPETAADYGVGSVEALFDVQTNVRVGTRHLQRLVQQYGIGKAVMAYNAGEGALERHNGFVTYAETQQYTHRVLTAYLQLKGVEPYSPEARQVTGITLTPTMAGAGGRGSLQRGDLSRLSLRLRPLSGERMLVPAAAQAGPQRRPMFVIERTD